MIFGAVAGMAGQLVGGLMANKAQRKLQKQMREQQMEKERSFARRYNENGLQRASAQNILNRTMEAIRARNEQAMGQQAVSGGTEASGAASKEAMSGAMAQTAGNILAQDDARKDALLQNMDTQRSQYNTQMNQMKAQAAQGMAQAAGQATNGIGDFVDSTKFGKKVNDKIMGD